MVLDGVADEQGEQGIAGQRQKEAEQGVIQDLGKNDGLWAGNGIVINKGAFFFPDKTLGHAVDHRKQNGQPEQGRPGGFVDGILAQAEREVANEDEAEQVDADA